MGPQASLAASAYARLQQVISCNGRCGDTSKVVFGLAIITGDDNNLPKPRAVDKHIVLQTRVTVGIWVIRVIARTGIGDGKTVTHGERIHEVLRGIDTSTAIEGGGKVLTFLCGILIAAVGTPENFGHFRGSVVNLRLVLEPDVTLGVETFHSANALEDITTHDGCISRTDTALIAEGGTGGKQCYLGFHCLGNLA